MATTKGVIQPPIDMPSQQVVAELTFWKLPVQPYLDRVEGETKIRTYVEPPVELPLEQLESEAILDRLSEMSPQERLSTDSEFVHHMDTDLIQVGVTDLTTLANALAEDPNLNGTSPHLEVLFLLSFGFYRLGQLSKARQALHSLLKHDPDNKKAKDLQVLLEDTRSNYTKLGLLALGLTIVAGVAIKAWSWSSSTSASSTSLTPPVPSSSSSRTRNR